MKTKTINTYKYSELSPEAQAKARDWFRDASQGDSFDAECVIDDAKQCLALAGFEIKNVFYSGFWSQGDGACFTGQWRASEVKPGQLQEHAPMDNRLKAIADGLEAIAKQFPLASLSVVHSGHYYHEYSTDFTVEIVSQDGDEIESPEREKAEKTLIELSRDAMRWIYKSLETEYEYRNSDEQIAESIEANEYDFTEEGKRSVVL